MVAFPILYDAVGGGDAGGGKDFSWSHEVSGNCVMLGLSFLNNTAFTFGAKVGSTDMDLVGSYIFWSSGFGHFGRVAIYKLLVSAAPLSNQTISVTFTGGKPYYGCANSVSYYNVGKVGSTGETASGNSATASQTASSASNNGLMFNIMSNAASAGTYSAYNQNARVIIPYNAAAGSECEPTIIGDAPDRGKSILFSATQASGPFGSMTVPLYAPNPSTIIQTGPPLTASLY